MTAGTSAATQAQAEELHGEVGKHGARIAHGIGDRAVGGMAEARVGHVPGAQAGQREGDAGKKPDAGDAACLATQEGLDAKAGIGQRERC